MRYIVIHHSGVDVDSSSEEIARYHIGLGWATIGYTYVARWDGTIEQALDLETQGNNVARRNPECLGICCPGDYTMRPGRLAQVNAKDALVAWLLAGPLPGRSVVGHRQIALPGYGTACPGILI